MWSRGQPFIRRTTPTDGAAEKEAANRRSCGGAGFAGVLCDRFNCCRCFAVQEETAGSTAAARLGRKGQGWEEQGRQEREGGLWLTSVSRGRDAVRDGYRVCSPNTPETPCVGIMNLGLLCCLLWFLSQPSSHHRCVPCFVARNQPYKTLLLLLLSKHDHAVQPPTPTLFSRGGWVDSAGEGKRCVASGGQERWRLEACERRWTHEGEVSSTAVVVVQAVRETW